MAVSARVQLFARDFGEGKRKSGKKLASLFVLFFLFHFSGEQYQTCQIRVGFCISAGERSWNLNERVVHLGFLIYSGCYHLNQRLNYAKYSNDSPNKRRLITYVPDPTSEMYVALLQISQIEQGNVCPSIGRFAPQRLPSPAEAWKQKDWHISHAEYKVLLFCCIRDVSLVFAFHPDFKKCDVTFFSWLALSRWPMAHCFQNLKRQWNACNVLLILTCSHVSRVTGTRERQRLRWKKKISYDSCGKNVLFD